MAVIYTGLCLYSPLCTARLFLWVLTPYTQSADSPRLALLCALRCKTLTHKPRTQIQKSTLHTWKEQCSLGHTRQPSHTTPQMSKHPGKLPILNLINAQLHTMALKLLFKSS